MLNGRNNRFFFPMGKNVLSCAKHFQCCCHATCLPCKTSIPKRDLNAKKTTANMEVRSENLGAMLEYWHIERDLLRGLNRLLLVSFWSVFKITSCVYAKTIITYLFFSISVNSGRISSHYLPRFQRIIVKYISKGDKKSNKKWREPPADNCLIKYLHSYQLHANVHVPHCA